MRKRTERLGREQGPKFAAFLFENLPFNYFTLRTNFEMSSKFWFNNTKKKLEELN